MTKTTDFGFQKVSEKDKARKVAGVFDSVAARYDLMNDLMSGGLHRLWKRFTVEQSLLRPGERVLDVASGTADLARMFARRVGSSGTVIVSDINAAMLKIGRDRLLDEGVVALALQCDAEKLPFPGDFFDCVSLAFGLRNMTHKEIALAEILRVLRPGGRLLVLEFSKVWKPLQPLYDAYSFQVLPKLGKLITGDPDSYRYLAESIRMHPDQEQLREMMEHAGFEKVEYFNLAAGVVALHKAYKF